MLRLTRLALLLFALLGIGIVVPAAGLAKSVMMSATMSSGTTDGVSAAEECACCQTGQPCSYWQCQELCGLHAAPLAITVTQAPVPVMPDQPQALMVQAGRSLTPEPPPPRWVG